MEVCLAYMTFKDTDEAKRIGKKLVQSQLVKCFNILSEGSSHYLWKGELVEDKETYCLAKLPEENFNALTEFVIQHHSYETPCLVKIPLIGGYAPYLEWLLSK